MKTPSGCVDNVSFITYEPAFADYYRNAEAEGLEVVAQVLTQATCEELENGARLLELQETLKEALENHFAGQYGGGGPWIQSLGLIVDFCQYWDDLEGDVDIPPYP